MAYHTIGGNSSKWRHDVFPLGATDKEVVSYICVSGQFTSSLGLLAVYLLVVCVCVCAHLFIVESSSCVRKLEAFEGWKTETMSLMMLKWSIEFNRTVALRINLKGVSHREGAIRLSLMISLVWQVIRLMHQMVIVRRFFKMMNKAAYLSLNQACVFVIIIS